MVTIIAQNLCPSIFRYLTPTAKSQRRMQPTSSKALASAGGTPVSRVAATAGAGGAATSQKMSSSSSSAMRSNVSGVKRSGGGGLGGGDGERDKKRLPKELVSTEVRDKRMRSLASYNRFMVRLNVDARIPERMGVRQNETNRFQGPREEENICVCLDLCVWMKMVCLELHLRIWGG